MRVVVRVVLVALILPALSAFAVGTRNPSKAIPKTRTHSIPFLIEHFPTLPSFFLLHFPSFPRQCPS